MADNSNIRRTRSLKNALSRRLSKREEHQDVVPPLPTHFGNGKLVGVRFSTGSVSRASSDASSGRPPHRNTWPAYPKEAKPGSYAFDHVPTLVRTPWEHDRLRRPASQWSRTSSDRRSSFSQAFERLPAEILHAILDHLRHLYSTASSLNVRDFRNDLRALCTSNKQLQKVASEHLYREIWTPAHYRSYSKDLIHLRYPLSQLERLLRTLKENPNLANLVRCLRITIGIADQLEREITLVDRKQTRNGSVDVLTQAVRHCPNLEAFLGWAPCAVDAAAGLIHALASCTRLRSHVWRLPAESKGVPSVIDTPGAFLGYHSNWRQLKTLVLSQPSVLTSELPLGTVNAVLQILPSLQSLVVRGLRPAEFHNGTLLMLPSLKSLRLEELHGITDLGLEQLAHSRLAFSLEKLVLYGLEITSIRTLEALFSNMPRLLRFTLHQNTSPELPQSYVASRTSFSLSSDSLTYLHCDVLAPGHSTTLLANSIASGRFPKLRKVKIPSDYNGAIQRLCRPIARQPLKQDDFDTIDKLESKPGFYRSLQASQIQAQIRIRESRMQPSFDLVVQDEDEAVQSRHFIGSYLGNMASKIEYSLEPAVENGHTALAETWLLTCPGPMLSYHSYREDPQTLWHSYCSAPDDTRELLFDPDELF